MDKGLKRKQAEESNTSKKLFLESLQSLEEQKTPKKYSKKKKVDFIKNSKPEEISKHILEREDLLNSSGWTIKHKSRLNPEDFHETKKTLDITKFGHVLKNVLSKLAEIPEQNIRFVESSDEKIPQVSETPEFVEEKPKNEKKIKKNFEDFMCCTPTGAVIKIPESYKRQKLLKNKQRIQSN